MLHKESENNYYILAEDSEIIASGTCRQLYLFLGMFVIDKEIVK
jgi:hypothetical protein